MSDMKIGFEMRRVRIPLADILPVRQVKDPQSNIKRYRTIRDSIKVVGLIEPLSVYPQKGAAGKYLLLDGHLRHYALKDVGETEAECIVARDDESFTYNARVNRLNPIAEHKMIMKAVQTPDPKAPKAPRAPAKPRLESHSQAASPADTTSGPGGCSGLWHNARGMARPWQHGTGTRRPGEAVPILRKTTIGIISPCHAAFVLE